MKYTIPVTVFAVLLIGCAGSAGRKSVAPPTVEDTVMQQLGGKLYFIGDQGPTDSITVIEAHHGMVGDGERYREYRFIVHNRYSLYHNEFESAVLDAVYNSYLEDPSFEEMYTNEYLPRLAGCRTEYIAEGAARFNGYWIGLTSYEGDYYLDDSWGWRNSFRIADTLVVNHQMDGIYPERINKLHVYSDGGFSIRLCGEGEVQLKFRPVDTLRQVYRMEAFTANGNPGKGPGCLVAPAEAIHNFEIIEYANNTGDLI